VQVNLRSQAPQYPELRFQIAVGIGLLTTKPFKEDNVALNSIAADANGDHPGPV
jgi:hypothetical protein